MQPEVKVEGKYKMKRCVATKMWLSIVVLSLAFTTKLASVNRHELYKASTGLREHNENGTFGKNFYYMSKYEVIKITKKEAKAKCQKVLFLSAFRYNFTLCLKQYLRVVAPDIVITVTDEISERHEGYESSSLRQIYRGSVNNIKQSLAYGKIVNNNFDGYFMIKEKYYFIEPISNFEPDNETDLHVIYIASRDKRTRIRFDSTHEENITSNEHLKWLRHSMKSNRKYSTEIKNSISKNNTRTKRSVSSMSCTVHLVSDHTFYENAGRKSVGATVSELIYRLGDADMIFRGTDFNGDGYGDNIGFHVSAISVFTSKNSYAYKFGDETLDVYEYLDTFSQYNFNHYCLGVAFTYRDFAGGVLGLAWVASSSFYGAAGGICQKQIKYASDDKLYSLNTAVVTMLNYGERVLSYEFGLVLTHEFGHNFGSSHDPTGDPVCSPDDENGNYLMYPYASEGSKPNHNRFSICSVNSMYPVIRNKGWCFISYTGPYCGNFIVEPGEECDCGDEDTCSLIDPCCSPQSSFIGPDRPCTLRRSLGYECSSKSSPCCTPECKFVSESVQHICSTSSECQFDAVCNGTSAACPENENKMNGTICDSGRKLCVSGFCSSSICNKFGLELCKCSGKPENECLVCCKFSNSSQCFPASKFAIYDGHGRDLLIKPGERCNSIVGFCDNRGKCMSKGDMGAIERIFSEETVDDIRVWFENYWYYVLVSIASLAFLVIVFVVTKKKTENVQVDAFRLGRLDNFMSSAEIEIKRQEDSLRQMEDNFDTMVKKVQRDDKSTAYVKAVGRLTTFFPTAPTYVITEVARKSSSESVAVRFLLMKGYPVRKVVTQGQPNT